MSLPDYSYADVSSQAGRTILITGASCGLGLSLAKDFFRPERIPVDKQPACLILACRDKEKTMAAIKENPVLQLHWSADNTGRLRFLELDLADLASVRKAAKELTASLGITKIDTLCLNAGVWPTSKQTTADGFELGFGTNHVGHFLFAKLCWPLVLALDVPTGTRKFNSDTGYQHSKIANVLFARELAKRCGNIGECVGPASGPTSTAGKKSVSVVTLSPGFAKSELYRDVNCAMKGMVSAMGERSDKLSINTMRACCDLSLTSGCHTTPKKMNFYGPLVVIEVHKFAQDWDDARKLWEETEKMVGEKFEV